MVAECKQRAKELRASIASQLQGGQIYLRGPKVPRTKLAKGKLRTMQTESKGAKGPASLAATRGANIFKGTKSAKGGQASLLKTEMNIRPLDITYATSDTN